MLTDHRRHEQRFGDVPDSRGTLTIVLPKIKGDDQRKGLLDHSNPLYYVTLLLLHHHWFCFSEAVVFKFHTLPKGQNTWSLQEHTQGCWVDFLRVFSVSDSTTSL